MRIKISSKLRRMGYGFVGFLMLISMMLGLGVSAGKTAYADPVPTVEPTVIRSESESEETDDPVGGSEATTTTETTEATEVTNTATTENDTSDVVVNGCKNSLGAIGWIVCPVMEKVSEAVDWLYNKIEDVLLIDPIPAEDGSPIYEIWKYCLGVTNIVFIIFLLVVIYSQLTGWGITNYGIKKALPKLIVMAIMVNLSFLICSLAVDVSNIIGHGLRSVFAVVEQTAMTNAGMTANETAMTVSMAEAYSSMAGGTALAVGAGLIAFEFGTIWMLIPTVLGAIVAVATGLITIALRQAVVMLLVMISPLAFVASILPNTEGLFKKWKSLLTRMLVFYPMFSLLFGASSLAGFAIIMSAKDGFGLLLGIAVQIFPLFFAWKMMQMSGTVLGDIGTKLRGLTARPLAANRAWADSHRQLTRQKRLATGRTPSARLMQFISNRRIAREEETNELAETAKLRGQAYAARRNYRRNGLPSREGEEAYARQAQNMRYTQEVDRHKNNMNKGLGQLAVVEANASKTQKARLGRLDFANVTAADALKIERARGEKIEYENAESFHKRMDDAINAHFDDKNRGKDGYKMHNIENRTFARTNYEKMDRLMEGDIHGIHYAAASAAQGYDTQKKIMETKMQKYFELTPPTKDVEYRLGELTKSDDAIANVDSIISGLRVLNQRGDTDLAKKYMEELLGHGVQLGTHASQALASFLMFEVKDSDPWLRRFGKYINLETARAYNSNDRQVMNVTYDEYIRGYHDGEPNTDKYPGGRMYAKKGAKQLVEGTSLDNIERTALSSFDESLKKAYGFTKGATAADWKVDEYLKKREEIQTAFEPAFLSASLKWLSGSEQINSGVKFWTGYELKQKKKKVRIGDEDVEQVVVDKNNNPVYEWKPVWEDRENGFEGRQEDVKKYFRRKTKDYFNDQTTGQILGMRTDYREPAVEHLLDMYLNDDGVKDEELNERRAEYEAARAEIQTRYGDEEASAAEKKRKADLTALKRDLAGRELRKILDKTGKLEQIYVTRRSGAANNAKDWLRKMLNLDDKDEIYRYLDKKDKENKERRNSNNDRSSGDGAPGVGHNDQSFRTGVMAGIDKIFNEAGDSPNSDEEFYSRTVDLIIAKFGKDSKIEKDYKEYKKNNLHASRGELFEKLEEILSDFFADLDE
ncbi:MFS transporter [Candidatus Saccharibacteria bacterium]|nr:MFS transporter [Candidatus Saccharibacteria bacterium]